MNIFNNFKEIFYFDIKNEIVGSFGTSLGGSSGFWCREIQDCQGRGQEKCKFIGYRIRYDIE